MLKQLYKHEFKALLRWLLFVWIGVIALSIINRCSTALFDWYIEKNTALDFQSPMEVSRIKNLMISLSASMTVLYAMGAIAGMLISVGLVVVRFYKNLFTKEGYFTFSIPVKPIQHIWCKLICGMVMIFASSIVVGVSVLINLAFTDVGSQLWQAVISIFSQIEWYDKVHAIFWILECVVLVILSISAVLLQFYCSISFGQSFKNKIGGSVISYIIINILLNTISSFFSFFFSIGSLFFGGFGGLDLLAGVDVVWVLHGIFLIAILIQGLICAGFFAITAYRTTKKLNLE